MSNEKRFELNDCELTSRFLIYAIVDPIAQSTVYVGKSSNGLKRPKSHFYDSSLKRKSPLSNWIKNQLSANKMPIITVLENSKSENKLNSLEKYYIQEALREEGALKNLTMGGGGISGYKRSEESKNAMSKKYKGKMPSNLCLQRNIESKFGKSLSIEHKEKLREKSRKSITILCLDNHKIYASARHVLEEFMDIKCHKSVLRAARLNKTIKGHQFIMIDGKTNKLRYTIQGK